MDEMAWMRPVSLLGMLMEHAGWGLHKLNIFFTIFPVTVVWLRLHCRADYVGTGREWIKWHRMRPQSSIGMYSELVGSDLPQFNTFFHNLAAVLIVEAAPHRRVDVV